MHSVDMFETFLARCDLQRIGQISFFKIYVLHLSVYIRKAEDFGEVRKNYPDFVAYYVVAPL